MHYKSTNISYNNKKDQYIEENDTILQTINQLIHNLIIERKSDKNCEIIYQCLKNINLSCKILLKPTNIPDNLSCIIQLLADFLPQGCLYLDKISSIYALRIISVLNTFFPPQISIDNQFIQNCFDNILPVDEFQFLLKFMKSLVSILKHYTDTFEFVFDPRIVLNQIFEIESKSLYIILDFIQSLINNNPNHILFPFDIVQSLFELSDAYLYDDMFQIRFLKFLSTMIFCDSGVSEYVLIKNRELSRILDYISETDNSLLFLSFLQFLYDILRKESHFVMQFFEDIMTLPDIMVLFLNFDSTGLICCSESVYNSFLIIINNIISIKNPDLESNPQVINVLHHMYCRFQNISFSSQLQYIIFLNHVFGLCSISFCEPYINPDLVQFIFYISHNDYSSFSEHLTQLLSLLKTKFASVISLNIGSELETIH